MKESNAMRWSIMRMESVLSKPGMNDNEIAHRLPLASGHLIMRYFATLLFLLMLTLPAISVELFRYRYQDRDGAEYEAVFETANRAWERRWLKRRRKKCGGPG